MRERPLFVGSSIDLHVIYVCVSMTCYVACQMDLCSLVQQRPTRDLCMCKYGVSFGMWLAKWTFVRWFQHRPTRDLRMCKYGVSFGMWLAKWSFVRWFQDRPRRYVCMCNNDACEMDLCALVQHMHLD